MSRHVLTPMLLTLVAATGCVSHSEHDALRAQLDAQTERAGEAERTRDEARARAAELEAQLDVLQAAHIALQSEQEQGAQRIETLERDLGHANLRAEARAVIIDDLRTRLRAHATTWRIDIGDVRAGRVFGLRPDEPPRGKLATVLRVAVDDERRLELPEDAILDLEGFEQGQLGVHLDDVGEVERVELTVYASGDDEVERLKGLVGAICADDPEFRWLHGRPGPGSPKPHPVTGELMPLVRVNTAGCAIETSRWSVGVRAGQRVDGAELNNADLSFVFETPPVS